MPTSDPKVLSMSNVFCVLSISSRGHSEVCPLRHCHHCHLFHMYLPAQQTSAHSVPRRILPLPLLPPTAQVFVRSALRLLYTSRGKGRYSCNNQHHSNCSS